MLLSGASQWLSFRLSFMGALVVAVVTLFVVSFPTAINAALVGLALNYALQAPRNSAGRGSERHFCTGVAARLGAAHHRPVGALRPERKGCSSPRSGPAGHGLPERPAPGLHERRDQPRVDGAHRRVRTGGLFRVRLGLFRVCLWFDWKFNLLLDEERPRGALGAGEQPFPLGCTSRPVDELHEESFGTLVELGRSSELCSCYSRAFTVYEGV